MKQHKCPDSKEPEDTTSLITSKTSRTKTVQANSLTLADSPHNQFKHFQNINNKI